MMMFLNSFFFCFEEDVCSRISTENQRRKNKTNCAVEVLENVHLKRGVARSGYLQTITGTEIRITEKWQLFFAEG
jgi:hypothetical protein